MCLEYDDRVQLRFTPDNPGLIPGIETAGEYIRDTATINIIDNDCKIIFMSIGIIFKRVHLLQCWRYLLNILTIPLWRVQQCSVHQLDCSSG